MGIIYEYKLLEGEDSIVDVRHRYDKRRTLTVEGHIIEEPLMPHEDVEKQFTSQRLLQLYQFLAEKSKQTKIYNKSQLAAALPRKANSDIYKPSFKCSEPQEEEATPSNHTAILPIQRFSDTAQVARKPKNALTAKLRPKIKVPLYSSRPANSSPLNCVPQDKRDILLKIRHQIFARKRLRQMAAEQLHRLQCVDRRVEHQANDGVWRPW